MDVYGKFERSEWYTDAELEMQQQLRNEFVVNYRVKQGIEQGLNEALEDAVNEAVGPIMQENAILRSEIETLKAEKTNTQQRLMEENESLKAELEALKKQAKDPD